MTAIPTIDGCDERALVARIVSRIESRGARTHPSLTLGIGDDAAIVTPVRNRVDAVTTDMLVEGVHFRREWSTPADIGAKAILVNVSDLGAMGAEPRVALLSLALPAGLPLADFDALIDGVADAARDAKVSIAGGNLTRSPGPMVVDVTAIGSVHARKVLRRDAARPGDEIWVTGTLGAGAAGLKWLEKRGMPSEADAAWPAVRRACRPAPPLLAGVRLSRAAASRAAIDLSDGLADGIRRMASDSGCGARIDAAAIPVDPSARAICEALGLDPLATALQGGDDYELLFTVPARSRGRFRSVRGLLGTPVTRIGVMTPEPEVAIEGPDGRAAGIEGGFDHFDGRSQA